MEHTYYRKPMSARFFTSGSKVLSGCAIALGLTMGVWGLDAAIAPQVAHAYVARVDVSLDRLPNERYEAMVRRAETVARAAAQRTFDKDILAREVSIVIVGRNAGFEAPILTLTVTREQWRSQPVAQRWATYYKNSASLLRLGSSAIAPQAFKGIVPSSPSVPAPVTSEPPRLDTPLPPAQN